MVKRVWVLAFVFLGAGLCAETSALLGKYDFEDGRLDAWRSEGNVANFTFMADADHTHSGRFGARFSLLQASEGARRRYIGVPLPVKRSFSKISIRFYFRSENIPAGSSEVDILQNSSKGPVLFKAPWISLKPSGEWILVESKIELKPEATGLVFYLTVNDKSLAKGSIWIDDLSFESVP